MVGIKVSKGHYLVTSAEVLDSLNPIATFLEFDEILDASVADPATINLGRLYFSEDNNRLSYRRRNDADSAWITVDLEGAGGGGTSFIGFTADANLNMGAFDITQNVAPATNIFKVIFNGAGSSDTYISNSTTDVDRINVWNNNVNTIAFTEVYFSVLNDLLMNTGKIVATTGQDLTLDTLDAGGVVNIIKPVTFGTGFHPSTGDLRLLDTKRINWEVVSGIGAHGLGFNNDVLNVFFNNIQQYIFTPSQLNVTGANLVNVGDINTRSIPAGTADFAVLDTTQQFSGTKIFENFQCLDATPAFIVESISKDAIGGIGVNEDDAQTITGQKNIQDLVCGTTNFLCLDSSATFQAGSIQGGSIADNTLGLDSMVHATGGYIITYSGAGVPSYLIAGTSGQVLTSNGAGNVLSWEDAGAGGSAFADNVFEVFDNVTSSKKITFQLDSGTGTNIFDVEGTSDTYVFPNGGGEVVMTQGNQTIAGTKTFTGATTNFLGDINMNTNYIQFDGIAVPATSTGEPKMFADSSNSDHMSVKSGDGTVYDLESSGGEPIGTKEHSLSLIDKTDEIDYDVYMSNCTSGTDGSAGDVVEDLSYWMPVYIARRCQIVRFGLAVTGGTTTTMYMGLYDNVTDQLYPKDELVGVSQSMSSSGGAQTIFCSTTNFEAGIYWLAIVGTTDTLRVTQADGGDINGAGYILDLAGTDAFRVISGFYDNHSSGLPATAPDEMLFISEDIASFVPMVFMHLQPHA